VTAPRPHDPRHLDVVEFARAQAHLAGEWPLADLGRLQLDALPLAKDSPAHVAVWSAQGQWRAATGAEAVIRLHLQARTSLRLVCQRCLQPMTVALDVQSSIRFVRGEHQAERLDEEGDEDVLALDASLDLRTLIEDELILALPLVPRHESCPQPLPMPADVAALADAEPQAHPFAALASLRQGSTGGGKAN